MRPLLITGCGGSGTTWIGEVVRAAGWPCSHEQWFAHADNNLDGFLAACAAEASGAAVPFAATARAHGAVVVHLIRHPLDVIAAIANRAPVHPGRHAQRVAWTARECPEYGIYVDQEWPVSALAYWLHWNRLAAYGSTHRLLVETITPDALARILDLSGRHVRSTATETALGVQRSHPGVGRFLRPTWEDLDLHDAALVADVRSDAERYGYI